MPARALNPGRELRSEHSDATPGSLNTIESFHLPAQLAPFLAELTANCFPPATMNGYQSDPGCFDTKHQCHSPGFSLTNQLF